MHYAMQYDVIKTLHKIYCQRLRLGSWMTVAPDHYHSFIHFYAPQLVPPGTAEARISYGISVCLSVRLSLRPSVTTRYRFNAR